MGFAKIEDKENEKDFAKNADMQKKINKGGRPPKENSEKINKQITVRVKETELTQLIKLAEEEGVSISILGRQALRKIGFIK